MLRIGSSIFICNRRVNSVSIFYILYIRGEISLTRFIRDELKKKKNED